MQIVSTAIFRNIATSAPLPQLKKFPLRGWSIRTDDPLRLLRKGPFLEYVRLQSIYLEGGWYRIFELLNSAWNRLTNLYFDDTFEDNKLLYFLQELGESKFPVFSAKFHPNNSMIRTGEEAVLQGNENMPNHDWVMRCVEQHLCREERTREYGPPGFFR